MNWISILAKLLCRFHFQSQCGVLHQKSTHPRRSAIFLNDTKGPDKMIRKIPAALAFAATALFLLTIQSGAVEAETYPARSIELTVPFGAGGGSDIFARTFVKVATDKKLISQPLVVNNKPGGSGAIGYAYVAAKKGDPYSLATVSSSFYTMPIIGKSPVSYKDFTPICGLAMDTLLLVVKADSKFHSVKDIIAAAKAKPKTLTVAGTGGVSDDAVMFHAIQARTGIEMKYVPFNSGGEVTIAVLGGHVDMAWANPGEVLGQLEAKKVRPLAVSAAQRLSELPNVPTLSEQGVDLVISQFRGIVAPKGISPDAVKYLEGACEAVSKQPEWKDDYLKKNMVEARYLSSEDFAKAIVDTSNMYEEFLSKIDKK
jgi:putative tricarboxylic transport membrane protein